MASKSVEQEAFRVLDERREAWRTAAGLPPVAHFRRPAERPFTAEERGKVTILFGGLTWKHDELIQAVFRGCGYRAQRLPQPNNTAYQLGREYGNNGQCNPTYFTVGNLIQFLRGIEQQGLSRQEIVDRYVFFTAGSCGPCRFGMYEAEYRMALENAGFPGFRILLFQQQQGIHAASGEPGLKFNVDFGMGMFNALQFGDVLNDLVYRIRPFEVRPGATDQALREVLDRVAALLREVRPFEILRDGPPWLARLLATRDRAQRYCNTFGKIRHHLYRPELRRALAEIREILDAVEVDRLRVKPVVKIVGEFWAQLTEGDGNFNMPAFLEREGAQVYPEPIAAWVQYLLYQAEGRSEQQQAVEAFHEPLPAWAWRRRAARAFRYGRKRWLLALGRKLWGHYYHRTAELLGGLSPHLAPQEELVRLAQPFYDRFLRGGEGYLEVAKNIYYTQRRKCHMVLALKPFGCMPSTQSDGAETAVVSRFPDMLFLPIETSGEGELNAHSRVQMALGEAKAKARAEFDRALASTGKSLDDLRDYAAAHPPLRRALYRTPERPGFAGTAARFALHVSDLLDARRSGRGRGD